jgi:hypothetical protein
VLQHNEGDKDLLMRQYELFVKTSSEATNWRHSSNRFYLMLNSALISIAVYVGNSNLLGIFILSMTGIFISVNWRLAIESYQKLNAAKFGVIKKLEKQLPVQVFSDEQDLYKKDKRRSFTSIEEWIPLVFIVAYISIALWGVSFFLS